MSEDSGYIWLDPSLLGDIGNVPSSDVLPTIEMPLSTSPSPIVHLLSLSKIALQHNFLGALLTIAGGVMALHYRTVIQVSMCKLLPKLTCKGTYTVANILLPADRCTLAAP